MPSLAEETYVRQVRENLMRVQLGTIFICVITVTASGIKSEYVKGAGLADSLFTDLRLVDIHKFVEHE